MNSKIENTVDGFLDRLFGPFQSQMLFVNIICGVILIIIGLRLLRNRSSERKKMLGWIMLAVGCLGIISGTVQLL
ncbi:putative membrane protein [Fontibacillus solani]|uniref:Putative membrane protein n=1 Tax=Fontibacillus solani TaxID=1572857 RepID=A0A7W3SV13_9BACL|nr:hypothetical protein [Fontibacillus solani]MBA9086639.1 putative membrane protein [Fontibacillus solani]